MPVGWKDRVWGRLGVVIALVVGCGGQTESTARVGVGGAPATTDSGGVANAARQTEVGGSSVGGAGNALGSGGVARPAGGVTGTGGQVAVVEQVVELCPTIYLEQVDRTPADVTQLLGLDITLVDPSSVPSSTIESIHYSARTDPMSLGSIQDASVAFVYGCDGRPTPATIDVESGGTIATAGFFLVSIDRNCAISGYYVDSQAISHVIDSGAGRLRLQSIASSWPGTAPNPDLITGSLTLTTNDGLLLSAQFELYLGRGLLLCD
jgi:hypothetical protein